MTLVTVLLRWDWALQFQILLLLWEVEVALRVGVWDGQMGDIRRCVRGRSRRGVWANVLPALLST